MDDVSTSELIEQARLLVGTRWLHRGRSATGVDCIGLVTLSMTNAGVNPVEQLGFLDLRDYSHEPSEDLLKQTKAYCTQIDTPIPGAMILFRFPNDAWPRHFGIYTPEGNLIHANAKIGKVVEHGYRMQWVKWTHSIWKIPGVDYV